MKKNALILLLLMLCGLAQAQHMLTLTFDEAVKTALQNNYDIQLARNDADIAHNNNNPGNAGMLPQLNATGGVGSSITNLNQKFVDGRVINRNGVQTDNTTGGLGLTWTLFDGTAMFINRSRLKQLNEMGEQNFKLAVENTIYQLAGMYYQLVRLQYMISVSENSLKVSADQVTLAENRYQVGTGSKLDFLQSKVDYNAGKSALVRAQYEADALKMQLNQLLARDAGTPFKAEDSIRTDITLQLEKLRQDMQAKNLLLGISSFNTHIAALDVKNLQAQRMPRIGFNAGYNFSSSRSQAGFTLLNQNSGLSYGLTASMSLFNGFTLQKRYENARVGLKSAELLQKKQQLQLSTSLSSAYLHYTRNLDLLKLEAENVSSARLALDIAMDKYRIGTTTVLETKNAQQSLLLAENNYISVQYEVKLAELELLKLSGNLVKGN